MAKKPARRWEHTDIELALRVVALRSGNTRLAAQDLKEQGYPIPARTLRDWQRRQYPDRYREIQAGVLPELHAKVASESEAIARKLTEAENATAERYLELVGQLER